MGLHACPHAILRLDIFACLQHGTLDFPRVPAACMPACAQLDHLPTEYLKAIRLVVQQYKLEQLEQQLSARWKRQQ